MDQSLSDKPATRGPALAEAGLAATRQADLIFQLGEMLSPIRWLTGIVESDERFRAAISVNRRAGLDPLRL